MSSSRTPLLLSPAETGNELYAVRPTTGPVAWLVLVGLLACLFGLGYVVPGGGVVGGTAVAAGGLVILGGLIAAGHLDKHRVCENALVLGLSPWPGGHAYLIPWSTVQPDTVTLHSPANRPGKPAAEMGSRGARAAVYSRTAVSVVGLHPDLADPRRRGRTRLARHLLATRTPEEIAADPPLIRWVMGTRHPEALLRAVEEAMVLHHPDARGLTDRALANPMAGGYPSAR